MYIKVQIIYSLIRIVLYCYSSNNNKIGLAIITSAIIISSIVLEMSIYSGFATRGQENYYDQVLYNVISTLLTRVAKFYRNEQIDENSFLRIVNNQ